LVAATVSAAAPFFKSSRRCINFSLDRLVPACPPPNTTKIRIYCMQDRRIISRKAGTSRILAVVLHTRGEPPTRKGKGGKGKK
jgi:hypothetical protein